LKEAAKKLEDISTVDRHPESSRPWNASMLRMWILLVISC